MATAALREPRESWERPVKPVRAGGACSSCCCCCRQLWFPALQEACTGEEEVLRGRAEAAALAELLGLAP